MTEPSGKADRDLATDLALAIELADAADHFTMPRYEAADFTLGWKDNRTEVTEADQGAEQLLVDRLLTARPGDSVFGEEHGVQGAVGSPWQWVIDPIDGTSGFVRGIPVWATLIALTHAGTPMLGVVSAPALGRRWWARRGLGSFADGRRCQVSDVADLADAQMCVTFSRGWDEVGRTSALVELLQSTRRARGMGDFWQHCLVAEGAMDVAIDAVGVMPYDLAAVKVIVEEAGGMFTDRNGVVTHEHDTAISSNGLLHDTVIGRLRD